MDSLEQNIKKTKFMVIQDLDISTKECLDNAISRGHDDQILMSTPEISSKEKCKFLMNLLLSKKELWKIKNLHFSLDENHYCPVENRLATLNQRILQQYPCSFKNQ